MVQLPGHVAGNVVHPEPDDLVSNPTCNRLEPLGDHRVQRAGGFPIAANRFQVQDVAGARHAFSLDPAAVQIGQQPTLARRAVLLLLDQLAPQIGAHILEGAGVPGMPRHPMLDVVMTERHVGPVLGSELIQADERTTVIGGAPLGGEHPFDLAVQHEDLVALAALGPKRRSVRSDQRLVRYCGDAEVERLVDETPGGIRRHLDPELLEQPENGAGLHRPRSVVIPGDEHDWGAGECLPEALELTKGEHDRGVGGPHRVKQISGKDDHVGLSSDDTIDSGPEGPGDVGLALIDAA
jgi:hypothetical protein